MTAITASLVKELRERTGSGMMECKKALEASNGDIEAAIEAMRKSGQAKAAKKAGRIAAEGVIIIELNAEHTAATMLEVNCETDFVAKDASFLAFANAVAKLGLAARCQDVSSLLAVTDASGTNVDKLRENLVAKIGENINIRRCVYLTTSTGIIGHYVHGNRIGVLVPINIQDQDLGKDIAMHIAASKPLVVNPDELPKDLLVKEEEIYWAQTKEQNKPAAILETMVKGKLQKFISESSLLKQPFIKKSEITVEQLLKQHNATVVSFVRYEVGEGIEKKSADFATEVENLVAETKS